MEHEHECKYDLQIDVLYFFQFCLVIETGNCCLRPENKQYLKRQQQQQQQISICKNFHTARLLYALIELLRIVATSTATRDMIHQLSHCLLPIKASKCMQTITQRSRGKANLEGWKRWFFFFSLLIFLLYNKEDKEQQTADWIQQEY